MHYILHRSSPNDDPVVISERDHIAGLPRAFDIRCGKREMLGADESFALAAIKMEMREGLPDDFDKYWPPRKPLKNMKDYYFLPVSIGREGAEYHVVERHGGESLVSTHESCSAALRHLRQRSGKVAEATLQHGTFELGRYRAAKKPFHLCFIKSPLLREILIHEESREKARRRQVEVAAGPKDGASR